MTPVFNQSLYGKLAATNSWTAAQTFSSVGINGGTIDGTVIGGATRAAVSCTTLTASGLATFTGTSNPASSTSGVALWCSGGTIGLFSLIASGAAVDEKIWDVRNTSGALSIRCVNDVYGGSTAALTITRSGQTPSGVALAATTTITGSAPGTPSAGQVLIGGGNVAAAGSITAGASSAVVGASTESVSLSVRNTTTAVGAFARISVQADTAPNFNIDMFSSTYTGAAWGITLASYAVFSASSSLSNGIIIGHTADKPIIFGINTSEVARLTSGTLASGRLEVDYTTASTNTTTGGLTVAGGLGVAGRLNVGSYITALINDAGTTNTATSFILAHTSSGTPAAGFGTQFLMDAQSTTTVGRSQALIAATWVDATDASRKARLVLNVYDTAAREAIRCEASGTAPRVGFLGAAAVDRQTIGAAATDPATTQTLANNIRTALINLGLCAT